jgi:hypothetical protein
LLKAIKVRIIKAGISIEMTEAITLRNLDTAGGRWDKINAKSAKISTPRSTFVPTDIAITK